MQNGGRLIDFSDRSADGALSPDAPGCPSEAQSRPVILAPSGILGIAERAVDSIKTRRTLRPLKPANLLSADSGIVINPHVYTKMSFDPRKDLVPITSVAANQFILAVNPKVPAQTLPEFIDYARKANPTLAFASGGPGSQHYFAMQILKKRAGIDFLSVTYRGGTPSMLATVAGETQVLFAGGESADNSPAERCAVSRQAARIAQSDSPIYRLSANSIPVTKSISGSACLHLSGHQSRSLPSFARRCRLYLRVPMWRKDSMYPAALSRSSCRPKSSLR